MPLVLAVTLAVKAPFESVMTVFPHPASWQPVATASFVSGSAVPATAMLTPRVSPSSAVAGMVTPFAGLVMWGCANVRALAAGVALVFSSCEPHPASSAATRVTATTRRRRLREEGALQRSDDMLSGKARSSVVEVYAVGLAHDRVAAVDRHGRTVAPTRREQCVHVAHAHLRAIGLRRDRDGGVDGVRDLGAGRVSRRGQREPVDPAAPA